MFGKHNDIYAVERLAYYMPDQLEIMQIQQGSGFFGDIGNWFKGAANTVIKKVVKPAWSGVKKAVRWVRKKTKPIRDVIDPIVRAGYDAFKDSLPPHYRLAIDTAINTGNLIENAIDDEGGPGEQAADRVVRTIRKKLTKTARKKIDNLADRAKKSTLKKVENALKSNPTFNKVLGNSLTNSLTNLI